MTGTAILVTGGAGFVGSHVSKALAARGYLPVAYDNLSNGSAGAVRWGPLERGDLEDEARLSDVMSRYRPAGVMHFAACIEAGASMADPLRFYRNNVTGSLALLRVMMNAGVERLVFSSTAAVYGEPQILPIPERHPLQPVNPYGRSKLVAEGVLRDMAAARNLFRFGILRYFNAAGADPDGELTESHRPETHLIPLALQAAYGIGPALSIFGTDYDTPDGTCIRDYVHVGDLAAAHIAVLDALLSGGDSIVANLGLGRGISVREVIETVGQVTGRPVPVRTMPRRPGDPAVLVAAADTARRALGWSPRFNALSDLVGHAARANGYPMPAAGAGMHCPVAANIGPGAVARLAEPSDG